MRHKWQTDITQVSFVLPFVFFYFSPILFIFYHHGKQLNSKCSDPLSFTKNFFGQSIKKNPTLYGAGQKWAKKLCIVLGLSAGSCCIDFSSETQA